MRPKASILLSKGHTAFLTADTVNIRYLTGVQMSSGLLLVQPKGYTLFADARYTEYAKKTALPDVTVRDVSEIDRMMMRVSQCEFNDEEWTVARLKRWKKRCDKTTFKSVNDPIATFRRVKSPQELANIQRALRITETMLKRIPSILKPGITEQSLAWQLETWARELGAEKLSFEPIVAFGTNTARPHHHPTSKKLLKGQIVQIDVGAVYKGYCADRSEVFCAGPFSARHKQVIAAVREAKDAAKAAVKEGVSTRELDRIARTVLKKHDLEQYFTHSLGHGVGLEIHEGINLSQKAQDEKLLKNEVITIEPGVYIPGSFGVRLEDMVVV